MFCTFFPKKIFDSSGIKTNQKQNEIIDHDNVSRIMIYETAYIFKYINNNLTQSYSIFKKS